MHYVKTLASTKKKHNVRLMSSQVLKIYQEAECSYKNSNSARVRRCSQIVKLYSRAETSDLAYYLHNVFDNHAGGS